MNSFSSIFDAELRFNDKWKLTSQFGYQLEKTSREEIADWESYAMRYYYKLSEYSQGGEIKHFLPEGGMQKSYENSIHRLLGRRWENIATASMIFMNWK